MTDRPSRPPAPPLPAFAELDLTHARILESLKQFDGLLNHLDTVGHDTKARRTASDLCKFFAGDARHHHAEEERTVFPGLLNGSDTVIIEQVHRLQQDHGWLEEDWRVLQPQVQAIADGIGGFDMEMLRHALPVFAALYRDHIALEESMIYPAARRQQAILAEGVQDRTHHSDPAPND